MEQDIKKQLGSAGLVIGAGKVIVGKQFSIQGILITNSCIETVMNQIINYLAHKFTSQGMPALYCLE